LTLSTSVTTNILDVNNTRNIDYKYTIETDNMVKEQHLWLIRYGKTDPGLIENVGNYDSDLHQEGIDHAKRIAQHIQASGAPAPAHIFSDPFMRCMRTADVLVHSLNSSVSSSKNSKLKLKVEQGMTEWQVPSLLVTPEGGRTTPRTLQELTKEFDSVDETYTSLNPQGPDRETGEAVIGTPSFPETEEELYARCRMTLHKMLHHVGDTDSIAIVSHAPCCQSTALALEGADSPAQIQLGPWSLGGVTHFSRPVGSEKWTLRSYSGTSHMPGEYKYGKLGQWSLPSFVKQ
jgi:broad specificity phosphatase PhoE